MNGSYGDELAIVPYVKHEIVAIAPILDGSFDSKHDCNDVIINSLNDNCVNDMHESIDNYDFDDLIETSLDEHDACYSCGHDANIYEDEFAIVPYVKT